MLGTWAIFSYTKESRGCVSTFLLLEEGLIRFALILAVIAAALSANATLHLPGTHRSKVPGVPADLRDVVIPNQIRIKFTPADAAQIAAGRPVGNLGHTVLNGGASSIADLTFISRIAHTGWTLWATPPGTDTVQLAAQLKTQSGVLYAETVHKVYPLIVDPNDADFNYIESSPDYIFDINDSGAYDFRRLWYLDDTNAMGGWGIWPNQWFTASTMPSHRPIIAVIDSGIDPNHPDFINAGGTGLDVSQGGQINFGLSGYVFLGQMFQGGDVTDGIGHGTHVAGLAVASANNGGYTYNEGDGSLVTDGILGMGYNCQAIILKVIDSSGNGTDTDAAAAIFYASDQGADVITLSLGDTSYSQLFQDAVTYAFQGGSLVMAAGYENGNTGGLSTPIYPAACSGCLAVEAEGPYELPATDYYAGVGNYVDIAAPGGDLLTDQATYFVLQYMWSTVPLYAYLYFNPDPTAYPPYWEGYTYFVGSSMAAPQVAGSAGLYYGMMNYHHGDGYVNVQTYRALENTADNTMSPPYGGWEPTMGYGGLNMASLMSNTNTRGSLVGSVKGIVYLNGSIALGVAVKAKNVNGGLTYSTTTTTNDGTYRFEVLPPGMYNITTAPGGNPKTKVAIVKAGSDQPGFDFWCGNYTGDTTPPVVPFFNVTGETSSTFTLHQWGYDQDTGIDSIYIQVGTSPGGSDVMPSTLLVPDTNTSMFTGLNLAPGVTYYVTGTYTNGNGPTYNLATNTTVVSTTFGFGSSLNPTGYVVNRGVLTGGNLSSLFAVDGNYLTVREGPTLNPSEAPVTVFFNGVAPSQTASSLGVQIVGKANTPGLTQTVSMFDYVANAWVALDTRNAKNLGNGTVIVTVSSPNRFIQSGTRAMQARLQFKQSGPTLVTPWSGLTDQVQFLYAP